MVGLDDSNRLVTRNVSSVTSRKGVIFKQASDTRVCRANEQERGDCWLVWMNNDSNRQVTQECVELTSRKSRDLRLMLEP